MYNFYTTKGSSAPAIKRAIIESELIEEFHWLPQDVKKIPYRDLQEFYIIRRQRRESEHQRQVLATEAQSRQTNTRGSGQMKRGVQVTKLTP